MCNINYKFMYYANLPFFYYSQFTVIIFFDWLHYIIVYNNCVNSFFIYVCLLTEIEFDVGVEGQLTYV